MQNYRKAIAQVVATVLAGLVTFLAGDNMINAHEWVNLGILGTGAISVAVATNEATGIWAYSKTILSGVSAALVVLSSAILGTVTATTGLQMGVAFLGALGVFAVENKNEFGV